MSLTRAMSTAYSGLATNSFRADLTASNIANASTPGYARREAVLREIVSDGRGSGVGISGVKRHQDMALTVSRRESDSAYGRANTLAGAYSQLNTEIGSPLEGYGLFATYEAFESSLKELASTPETPALQNAVLATGKNLVSQLNTLSQFTNDMKVQADRNIAESVSTVNESLHRLQQLNVSLSRNDLSGGATALEDERQRLLDTISEIIPIKTITNDDGSLDVITPDGVFLLSGTVHELSFEQAVTIPHGASYGDGSGVLSGLFVGDQELTPGTSGNFAVKTGTLAGQFAVRDKVTTEFSAQLDSLAADLITRLSDDSLDPTKPAGAPGLFTDAGGAFDMTNQTGIAARISVNTAVDPEKGGIVTRLRDGLGATTLGDAGDASIINGLVSAIQSSNTAPTDSGLTGNFSVAELIAGVSSLVGENRVRHDALSATTLARSNFLFEAELSKSGVDTDQEMQSLLLIEQAYSANARVIQTVGEMIDRLLQI